MKTLIVEDDFTSRLLLQSLLSRYGECHGVVNGYEAIKAFCMATDQNVPYNLVCMDILMPGPNGPDTVRSLRAIEEEKGVLPQHGAKVIMTTGLNSARDVSQSFNSLCDAYLTKPIDVAKLLDHLKSYQLVS
jgi:two-component system chemotaxis response regulator CheY